MELTGEQRNMCLEYMSQMAYAKSDAEYNRIYGEFSLKSPRTVKTYFDKNWHPIREKWVMGFKFSTGNFLNATNNRLESLNGKLKQVISKYSSIEDFIKQFFIVLAVMRNERSYKTVYSYQKVRVLPYAVDSPETAYINLLTGFSSTYVLNQPQISYTHTYHWQGGTAGSYQVDISEDVASVTTTICTYTFFKSMLLPCWHTFSLCSKNGVSLYDQSLCDGRWTKAYYHTVRTSSVSVQ